MTYMFKIIAEVVCVRSFQDDKIEGKFVEVDYEIPPKVVMTNCTQNKILLILSIRVQNKTLRLRVFVAKAIT